MRLPVQIGRVSLSDTIVFTKMATAIMTLGLANRMYVTRLSMEYTTLGHRYLEPSWYFGDSATATGNFVVTHNYGAYATQQLV